MTEPTYRNTIERVDVLTKALEALVASQRYYLDCRVAGRPYSMYQLVPEGTEPGERLPTSDTEAVTAKALFECVTNLEQQLTNLNGTSS